MKNPFGILGRFYTKEGKGELSPIPERGPGLYWMIFKNYWRPIIGYNALTFLLSIPLITAPAAIYALNRVEMKLVIDKVCLIKEEYWSEFKRSFLKSIPVMALGTGAAVTFIILIYEGLTAFDGSELTGYIIAAVALLFLIIEYVFMTYMIGMDVIIDLPTKTNASNALILSLGTFRKNIFLLIPLTIELLLLALLPYSAVVLVLLIPAFTSLFRNVVIKPIIEEKIIKK